MQRIGKTRGIKGAASWCAFAAILYLLCQYALQALASYCMGLQIEGASLENPIGYTQLAVQAIRLGIGVLALVLPVIWLLEVTRLGLDDLRLTRPPQWSPVFCLIIFLGLANFGNVLGALISRLLGLHSQATQLPAGGIELVLSFCTLCLLPALGEELLFRGALQGLMRPCGSGVAIIGPALLFALLHLDLSQAITAFLGGIFLGWLAERTGSVLPGMLLHLINNIIAFAVIYLQLYEPGTIATVIELAILLVFPIGAVWLVWRAVSRQGFSFTAGMHPGVEPYAVFSSPAYTLAMLVLVGMTIWQTLMPS